MILHKDDSRDILVHTHMGMGDHLVLSGMVRKIAEINSNKRIFLATRSDIHNNVEALYSDTEQIIPTNISFYPKLGEMYSLSDRSSPWIRSAEVYADMNDLRLINVGFYNHRGMDLWDKSFYDSMGLDYDIRYQYFKVPEQVIQQAEERYHKTFHKYSKNSGYIFIHDDPNRGYNIRDPQTNLAIVRNSKLFEEQYSIFDMIPVIKNASELHMMGSSLICLCDLLSVPLDNAQKCYYYASFRGFSGWPGVEKWKIL